MKKLFFFLIFITFSLNVYPCGSNEYEQCYRACVIPNIFGGGCSQEIKDCKCLPKIQTGPLEPVVDESKRAISNLARELGKTPEAMQECFANVQRCATEIMSAPTALLAQAYIDGLYRQSEGRVQSFTPEFINMTQRYYQIDLRGVTYAENIDTGHGQSLAYCDRIFFTHPGNVWEDKNELFLTLHEIEHLVQCQKRGRRTFLSEYLLKGLSDVAKNGTFDVHDLHDFEVAADAKANQLTDVLWNQIQEARRANRYSYYSPYRQ